MNAWNRWAKRSVVALCAVLAACSGGGGGGGGNGPTCDTSVVSVSIEPAAATVVAGTPQPFVAAVTSAADTAVTWTVEEGAIGGTISNTGVYTAPATPGTYHVIATSQADSCGTATATVTVVAASTVAVSISPAGPVAVQPGGSQAFLATVTGTADTRVDWSVQGTASGTITASGVYTADDSATSSDFDYVIATSKSDPSKSAQVLVTIEPAQVRVISPGAVTVAVGGRVDFALSAETIAGGWHVDGVEFGNDTVGTIDQLGAYVAPYQMPTSTTAVLSATITNSHTTDPTNSATVNWVSRFQTPETLQVDGCVPQCAIDEPNAIVAADFNNDGLSDLATANSGTGTVSLLIAADESHFAVPYRLQVGDPTTGDPQALDVAYLNGGSILDLVIADADPSTNPSEVAVRTRLGQGDGTFGDEKATALPSGSSPISIAWGQFDSDPDHDVAVANFATNTVNILRGAGDGTFEVIGTITAGISAPLGIAVADFNGGGIDDVAVANSGNGTVSIHLSNADGTFAPPQVVQLPVGSIPSSVAAVNGSLAGVKVPGSFNGDNYPDLVVTTMAPTGGLTVIFNSADSDAAADPRFLDPEPTIPTGTDPVALAIGNFNRDSVYDVVVANRGDDTVTTYFFDPASDALVESETYAVGQTPQALAVGDFNGDGWDDVAVVNNDDDTVSILRNRGGPTATP